MCFLHISLWKFLFFFFFFLGFLKSTPNLFLIASAFRAGSNIQQRKAGVQKLSHLIQLIEFGCRFSCEKFFFKIWITDLSTECLSSTRTMCNHFLFYAWEISLQNYFWGNQSPSSALWFKCFSNSDSTLWLLPQPMLDAELPFTPVKTRAQKFAAAEVFCDLIMFSPVGPSGDQ